MVSRKWLATLTTAEETSTQVEVAFLAVLDAEDLLGVADEVATAALRETIASGDRDAVHDLAGGGHVPLLLAIGDNSPQMRSVTTREFMAGTAIAQQFARPRTQVGPRSRPCSTTSKASGRTWRRSATRRTRRRARQRPACVHRQAARRHRLRPPDDDEHQGRGDAIRQARRDGLARARLDRIEYHRNTIREENQ